MRNRFAAALAVIMIALGLTVLVDSPVAAKGWPGGIVEHAADDSGYNPPITVKCDNGRSYMLGLGTSSKSYCGDVDYVWVAKIDRLVCYHTNGVWQVFQDRSQSRYHAVNGNWTNMSCYQQYGDNSGKPKAGKVKQVAAKKGWPGGEVTHSAADTGYLGRAGGALFFRCDSPAVDLTLYRGQWSKGTNCSDVNYLYVFPEEVHVCDGNSATGFAHKNVYYPGMSIGNLQGWTCKVNLR